MKYLHLPTYEVKTIDQLRAELPAMSIPDGADLSDRGYQRIEDAPLPVVPAWHRLEAGQPYLDNGVWRLGWNLVPFTNDEVVAVVVSEVQQRLDAFARTHNYDGILSACTYAASTVPKFAAEGQYAVVARDNTWATCYQILGDVLAGLRPMPSLEDVLAELPPLAWPVTPGA